MLRREGWQNENHRKEKGRNGLKREGRSFGVETMERKIYVVRKGKDSMKGSTHTLSTIHAENLSNGDGNCEKKRKIPFKSNIKKGSRTTSSKGHGRGEKYVH